MMTPEQTKFEQIAQEAAGIQMTKFEQIAQEAAARWFVNCHDTEDEKEDGIKRLSEIILAAIEKGFALGASKLLMDSVAEIGATSNEENQYDIDQGRCPPDLGCKGAASSEPDGLPPLTEEHQREIDNMAASSEPQEWTKQYVHDIWLASGGSFADIADAHNAELAAEQQKRADWNVVIEDLEAAVKSKEAELQAFLTDADSARESWMKELAAERKLVKHLQEGRKVDFENYLNYTAENARLKQQLLAAQAAMQGKGQFGQADIYEIRKPLVEALALTAEWLKASLECDQHVWEPDQRAAAQETLDVALASVKEGK